MAVDTTTAAPAGKISGAIGIRAAAFRSGGEEARFNNSGSGSTGPDSDRHLRSARRPDLKRAARTERARSSLPADVCHNNAAALLTAGSHR
jgi:hypothetical protein